MRVENKEVNALNSHAVEESVVGNIGGTDIDHVNVLNDCQHSDERKHSMGSVIGHLQDTNRESINHLGLKHSGRTSVIGNIRDTNGR